MAVTNYSSLISTTRDWVGRNDSKFVAQLPQMISFAEDRIYHGHGEPGDALYSPPVRTVDMETSATMDFVDGVGTVPDDSISLRALSRSGDPNGLLYLPPNLFQQEAVRAIGGGLPSYYTHEGNKIKLLPAWNGQLKIIYYKRFPPLSVAAPDNPMIVGYGNLYLAATLFEAYAFSQEAELASGFLERYRAAVAGVNHTAAKQRTTGNARRVRMRQVIGG